VDDEEDAVIIMRLMEPLLSLSEAQFQLLVTSVAVECCRRIKAKRTVVDSGKEIDHGEQ